MCLYEMKRNYEKTMTKIKYDEILDIEAHKLLYYDSMIELSV
jgi:hypothetical protein